MLDLHCWQSKFQSCNYSNRLLIKLAWLNQKSQYKIDFSEIKKAIYYAKKYHGSQKRQSGEPYYSHPLQVAYMIADHRFTTDILVTSILHDTIEDTELTESMISYIFSPKIASQVAALTRVKSNQKISAAEIIKTLWQQGKNDLLLIKYFDRVHNMQTIKAKSSEKILKIVDETFKEFLSLGIYFKAISPDLGKINENIVNLCYQQLPIKRSLSLELIKHSEDNFQLPFPNFQNE